MNSNTKQKARNYAMKARLAIIAAAFAFAGYILSLVAWRWWIGRKWRNRQSVREQTAELNG